MNDELSWTTNTREGKRKGIYFHVDVLAMVLARSIPMITELCRTNTLLKVNLSLGYLSSIVDLGIR